MIEGSEHAMGAAVARLTAVALGVAVAACGGQSAPAARGAGSPAGDRVASTPPADTGAAVADKVGPQGQRITHLDVAGHDVTAEIAESAEDRARGLMYRDSLPADHGMLFVYPRAQILGFWMRNTKIPLDIAFIDPRGLIVDIQHMEPESDSTHTSARPAMYALEMASGWFDANGVKAGDRVGF